MCSSDLLKTPWCRTWSYLFCKSSKNQCLARYQLKRLYRSRLTSVNPNAVGFVPVVSSGFVSHGVLVLFFENVDDSLMSLLSPPQIPLFRITLFYGPETVAESIHCVFNVKKRSWKGGVQVGIVVEKSQIQQLEDALAFQPWIEECLRKVPGDEREDYRKQGYDLFIQFICFHKLEIYIHQGIKGIKQENTQVASDVLVLETDEAIQREAKKIKQQIIVELDVEEFNTDRA